MEKRDNDGIIRRTREARENAGLEQKDMAKALGIEYQAYNKYEKRSPIKQDLIAKFCKVTGISADWLVTGGQSSQAQPSVINPKDTSSNNSLQTRVPVYGYAAGSTDRVAINEGGIVGMRDRGNSLIFVRDAFYIMVIGDSMEPRMFPGEYVAVNPSVPPIRGKDCVVEFHNGEAIVKVFISKDGDTLTLAQYNPKKNLKVNMKEVKNIYSVAAIESR